MMVFAIGGFSRQDMGPQLDWEATSPDVLNPKIYPLVI